MCEIEKLINTPYKMEDHSDRECWSFCKKILSLLDKPIPQTIRGLKRIDGQPEVGDLILFNLRDHNWHTGIVWPNSLFFIHARPLLNSDVLESTFMIEKKSIKDPLYSMFIDGYYRG